MKSKKLSALLLAGLMTASAVSFTEIIPCTKFTAYGSATGEYPNARIHSKSLFFLADAKTLAPIPLRS